MQSTQSESEYCAWILFLCLFLNFHRVLLKHTYAVVELNSALETITTWVERRYHIYMLSCGSIALTVQHLISSS